MPPRSPEYKNLVLVTHGWNPGWRLGDLEKIFKWVDDMAEAIFQRLQFLNREDWIVVPYLWLSSAPEPNTAISFAQSHGRSIGKELAAGQWDHVHLIGHSAGSALIQAATETLKKLEKNSTHKTTVHTTFLDPFVGLVFYAKEDQYGKDADWADCYFADDWLWHTQSPLDHAYDVDVTWLDSQKKLIPIPCAKQNPGNPNSLAAFLPEICNYEASSRHEWPWEFYLHSIANPLSEFKGHGFALSKEAGGDWENIQATYRRDVAPKVLGDIVKPVKPVLGVTVDDHLPFSSIPTAQSGYGMIQVENAGFQMITPSPFQQMAPQKKSLVTSQAQTPDPDSRPYAWLSSAVVLTNPINFVSFDAQFLSPTGALGLLKVFWNTNEIGFVDETVVLPGWRNYTMGLPGVFQDGQHVLGFRMDAFTNIASGVAITNVALGFAGNSVPPSIEVERQDATNTVFILKGPAGFHCLLQASSDMEHWTNLAVLQNTNGTVRFTDTLQEARRFYRAFQP